MITTVTTTVTTAVTTVTTTETVPDTFIRGDISRNGRIDLYDAIEIAKYLINMRDLTSEEEDIADYNYDGRVDLYDAVGIAKYLLTLI